MKYLVPVADDFGFSSGANTGSIEGYKEGIIKELSLMMNTPGTDEAVQYVLEEGLLNVGIHLMLYDLIKDGRYIHSRDYELFLDSHDKDFLEQRVKDEFKKFEDKIGRPPTHISSHQYTHKNPKLFDVIGEYANKHNIFIRKIGDLRPNGDEADKAYKQRGAKVSDYIFSNSVGSYDELSSFLIASLKSIAENSVTEMFFYPAYMDSVLMRYSTLTFNRYRDLQLVTNPKFKEEIEELGFKLVSFGEVN